MPDESNISPFLTGNTSFASSDVPQLTSGDYVLTASIHASGNGITSSNTFDQSLSFSVAGPRFRLQESDILQLSPADESLADNQNTLPSVYFTRSTLPWERSAISGVQGAPWLAIVLVNEDEAEQYEVTNLPLSDFLPSNELESTDDPNEIVTVLSIEANLASSILPLYEEVYESLIAHVRYMDANDGGTPLRRAIVLGTRLPAVGLRNTCFLVSIENGYSSTTQSLILPGNGGNLSLAVLKTWSFTNTSTDYDFEGLMTAPSMAPATLRLPSVASNQGIDPEPWLAKGYVLLPSYYRSGESSAAWYHGPLAPGEDQTDLPLPTLSPDSLQIFNTALGIMDAGYASAWELGRLMSLANANYSQAVYAQKQARNIRQVQWDQARETDHLPVQSTQTAWNQITANQTAFFRLYSQTDAGQWLNILDQIGYGSTNGQPYPGLNEAFGCSPVLSSADSLQLPLLNMAVETGFAFCFWVFLAQASDNEQTLATLFDTLNPENTLRVFAQGDSVYLRCGDGSWAGPASPIAQGWHQIGVSVAQPSTGNFFALLYVDGQIMTQAPIAQDRITFDQMLVGNEPTGNLPGPGSYANVRMSQSAWGEAEFQALYGYDLSFRTIYQHLNNLKCLKGLPFGYLVPDATMIPPESLRIFTLSQPWLASLMDGATSLARISEAQLASDAEWQIELGLGLPGKATGILLRSAVVNAFPTLEIEGYSVAANGTDPMPESAMLPILRKEILSQDVIFILFLGNLVTLDIHPHSETLHYGVYETSSTNYLMNYRNTEGQEMPVGHAPQLISQPFRESQYRTLNLSTLSATLSGLIEDEDFDGGTLGMELLGGGQLVRYNLTNN